MMSVYNDRVGQSLGDINILTKGQLSTHPEQLRNATSPTFEKLTMFTLDLALDGLRLPFGIKDSKIRSLRDLNQELLARVKEDF
jgi:hypothetical protein